MSVLACQTGMAIYGVILTAIVAFGFGFSLERP